MSLISAIVPCRNEAPRIGAFCASVAAQLLPHGSSLEIVIADGGSDDGTRERLAALAAVDARFAVIDNPQRIVSAGLNRALAAARGDVIVRMDVHTEYAPDYIAQCLVALASTGADNVGGPWHARPDVDAGPMQQAVAAAFQSRWVAGGALSRRLDHDGWVDTVYLGCWPRATFSGIGGFDEALVRNQDDEHNLRLRKSGGRIWQSSSIRSVYHPRTGLMQVFRQYLQYGYWKPFVMKKHGQAASPRHVVPGLFVALLVLAALLALARGPALPMVLLGAAYGLALAGLTAAVALTQRLAPLALLCVPAVIGAYHFGYGIGSIAGWWDALRGRPGRERFAGLTR